MFFLSLLPPSVYNLAKKTLEVLVMFYHLWGIIPQDCKVNLVGELLFAPNKIRLRFVNEALFRHQLKQRWQKE